MTKQNYYFLDKSQREMEFITQILDDLNIVYKLKEQQVEIPIFAMQLPSIYTISINVEPEFYEYVQYEINKRINERSSLESCLKETNDNSQINSKKDEEINSPIIVTGTIHVGPHGIIIQRDIPGCSQLDNVHELICGKDEDDEDDEDDCDIHEVDIPEELVPMILQLIERHQHIQKQKQEKQLESQARVYPQGLWKSMEKKSLWNKLKDLFKK